MGNIDFHLQFKTFQVLCQLNIFAIVVGVLKPQSTSCFTALHSVITQCR